MPRSPFFAAVLFLAPAGCSALAPDPGARVLEGDGGSVTIAELELRTKNFADRYVQLLADAVDDIKERSESPKVRYEAHRLKLESGTSAWDLVTSSHPLQEMLDLFVQVELQRRIWVEDGLGARKFGARGGERVAAALETAQQEILLLARRAMPDEQVREIQDLLEDWRRRNPSIESGAFLRFGPYLESPGGGIVASVLSGFGILDLSLLNPLDPAAKEVGRVGRTADDAFYMAKRLPMLLQWQSEAAAYEVLLTVDAAAREAEGTLKRAESLVRAAGETARSAQGAFAALEKITNPEKEPSGAPEGPPGRPFDIREYAEAAERAAATAREARELFRELKEFGESPALSAPVREIGDRAESLLTQALAQAVLLLLVFFVLLSAYRALLFRLQRPANRPPKSELPPAPRERPGGVVQ